jgi:hypothetical protein
LAANATSVSIADTQMIIVPASDRYLPPNFWRGQPEENKEYYFTMDIGDLAALGEHDIEINHTGAFTLTEARELLAPNCFIIQSIKDNTRSCLGRHWKIQGV